MLSDSPSLLRGRGCFSTEATEMATIAEALALALRHHQAGALPLAEQLYRQILQVDPCQVHALHLLGVLACQTGRLIEAVGYIRQSLARGPLQAEAHSNLGVASW